MVVRIIMLMVMVIVLMMLWMVRRWYFDVFKKYLQWFFKKQSQS